MFYGHHIANHFYVVDTQIYLPLNPDTNSSAISVTYCLADDNTWLLQKFLYLWNMIEILVMHPTQWQAITLFILDHILCHWYPILNLG